MLTCVHGRALVLALFIVALLAAPARADVASPQQGLGAPQLTDNACADKTFPDCRRMRFAYGPVTVGPGANLQLVSGDIAKPMFDGYVTRLTANLYRTDGTIPRVDVVHLHHGAWFSTTQYGNTLPFFAAGEEKTHMELPGGYGMRVGGGDQWGLAYMLHNLTPITEHVYVTYDIDYVPAEPAEAGGIKRARPLWLDVMMNKRQFYPVFNVQRGFGHYSPKYKRRVCTFPLERCAAMDPFGQSQPADGPGWDWQVPADFDGTLVAMGGHVHPGGLEDQVSVVRGRNVKRIFNSEAKYFDKRGPVSWDLAMTVTKPDWRVRIRTGDKLRLNAVYDAQASSWYENMGIVVGFVAPGDDSGVDPFAPGAKIDTTGNVTHGHLAENDNHGGTGARKLKKKLGPVTSRIGIKNFVYKPGDLTTNDRIPRVRLNRPVTFTNGDDSESIWHTITPCRFPCTARTGISYPLANAMPALDSTELGTAPGPLEGFQAASQKLTWKITPRKVGLRAGQTYTYFCRIHPFMRGAFKVVK